MKTNRLVGLFQFLFLAMAFQLFAQQSETDRKSFEEIKVQAEKGNATAQSGLGARYALGLGVMKDNAEAAKWYRKAAEQGNADAQALLGIQYAVGNGVSKNVAEAAKWYRRAAEQNHPEAQNLLADCYRQGEGVTQSTVESIKWYKQAAEKGVAAAQCNLGSIYLNGAGVAKNYDEALKWLRMAAEQGYELAQSKLGAIFEKGMGIPKNYAQAYKWYSLASAQGDDTAGHFLSYIEKRMTPEQIAEGQRLAVQFRPNKESGSGQTVFGKSTVDSQPTSGGSGFFITDDGYLITNEHVVKGAAQVRLVTSASLISAQVVKVDAANDLALLKAEGRFASLPIAASRAMRLGSTVATVGFPNIGLQGFAPKFARGEIASLSGAGDDARYFQISVPVQPGNSGGALVDERGNVVGVVSAKLNAAAALASSGSLPENVNYAVKSSYLLSFLEVFADGQLKLKEANAKEIKFEAVVEQAKQAAVLVLVY